MVANIRFSVVLLALLAAMPFYSSADNVLTNFANKVGNTACLLTITPKLTSDCGSAFNEELKERPQGEENKKSNCCAFLRLQSCALKIAEKECGDEAEAVAKGFLNEFNRDLTSDDCVDYGFITCITMMQWAIAAAVAVAVFALLSCICCCCCRR